MSSEIQNASVSFTQAIALVLNCDPTSKKVLHSIQGRRIIRQFSDNYGPVGNVTVSFWPDEPVSVKVDWKGAWDMKVAGVLEWARIFVEMSTFAQWCETLFTSPIQGFDLETLCNFIEMFPPSHWSLE